MSFLQTDGDDTLEALLAELQADLSNPSLLSGYVRDTGKRDCRGWPVFEPDNELIAMHRALIPHVGQTFTLEEMTAPLLLVRENGPGSHAILRWVGRGLDYRPGLCARLVACVAAGTAKD